MCRTRNQGRLHASFSFHMIDWRVSLSKVRRHGIIVLVKDRFESQPRDEEVESKGVNLMSEAEFQNRLMYAQDILDKRYRNGFWLDGRAAGVTALNGLSVAANLALLDNKATWVDSHEPWVRHCCLAAFCLSILCCAVWYWPRLAMRSDTKDESLNQGSTRTTLGIDRYSADDYRAAIRGLSHDGMLNETADAIKFVNSTIIFVHKCMRGAIALALLGILLSVFATAYAPS